MTEPGKEEHIPGLEPGPLAWIKAAAVIVALVIVNLAAFVTSYGWGVVITLPISVFLAFILLRDLLPRHRFPRGRFPRGRPPRSASV